MERLLSFHPDLHIVVVLLCGATLRLWLSACLCLPKQAVDARLREAETELAAARRLLREAGAERELLRHRLEQARQETEDLLRGSVEARKRFRRPLSSPSVLLEIVGGWSCFFFYLAG